MALINCPGCRAATVPAVSWEFSQTAVEVAVCERCQAAGLVSVTVPVTAMTDLELPTAAVRHSAGLVEFGR